MSINQEFEHLIDQDDIYRGCKAAYWLRGRSLGSFFDVVDDLQQHVRLQLITSKKHIETDKQFPWSFRVATNWIIDEQRKLSREKRAYRDLENKIERDFHSLQFTPGDAAHPWLAFLDAFITAFKKMTPKQRDSLKKRLKNKRVKEIAAERGTSSSSVSHQIARAIEIIRQEFVKQGLVDPSELG